MKFPGGVFNPQQLMKRAHHMHEKMQREMAQLVVDAAVGGGIVTVQMRGNHEVVSVKIQEEAARDDIEMLQDLLVAAFNEANRKVEEAMQSKIGGMMPPGMGF